MNNKIELKPCPFCGSHKVEIENILDFIRICCKDCKVVFGFGYLKTEEEAADKWNRRAENG